MSSLNTVFSNADHRQALLDRGPLPSRERPLRACQQTSRGHLAQQTRAPSHSGCGELDKGLLPTALVLNCFIFLLMLGIESKALGMLSIYFIDELHSQSSPSIPSLEFQIKNKQTNIQTYKQQTNPCWHLVSLVANGLEADSEPLFWVRRLRKG